MFRAAAERKQTQRTVQRTLRDHFAARVKELAATREYLQSVIEQQEAANEELQSTNEEMVAVRWNQSRGELDGIIEPAQTRVAVAKALRALRGKRASLPPKKHGNIPL